MNIRLFGLRNNSSFTRGFTWAASIVARSEVSERRCACGAVSRELAGAFDVVVEGGTKYPDILGCGEYPFLIVTERVADAWKEALRAPFQAYPVGIAEVTTRLLRLVPPPRYYRIELEGRCDIDLEASGAILHHQCECGHIVTEPSVLEKFIMRPGSWDGSDLFRDSSLYPRITFCTTKVLDLAAQHRFTNFRFEPMEGPFNHGGKGIDYLKGKH